MIDPRAFFKCRPHRKPADSLAVRCWSKREEMSLEIDNKQSELRKAAWFAEIPRASNRKAIRLICIKLRLCRFRFENRPKVLE